MGDKEQLTAMFTTDTAQKEQLLRQASNYLEARKDDPHAKRIKALIEQYGNDEQELRKQLFKYMNTFADTQEAENAFDAVEIITMDPIYKNYRYNLMVKLGKQKPVGQKEVSLIDKILDLFTTKSSLAGEGARVYGELHEEDK